MQLPSDSLRWSYDSKSNKSQKLYREKCREHNRRPTPEETREAYYMSLGREMPKRNTAKGVAYGSPWALKDFAQVACCF